MDALTFFLTFTPYFLALGLLLGIVVVQSTIARRVERLEARGITRRRRTFARAEQLAQLAIAADLQEPGGRLRDASKEGLLAARGDIESPARKCLEVLLDLRTQLLRSRKPELAADADMLRLALLMLE